MAFFLESIALHDITAAQRCFGMGTTGDRPSPQEGDRYSYSKCTVVVRVLEFSTTLLGARPDGWKVGLPSHRSAFPELSLCGSRLFLRIPDFRCSCGNRRQFSKCLTGSWVLCCDRAPA